MRALALPLELTWTEAEWAQRLRCFSEAMGVTSRRALLHQSRSRPGPMEDLARQVLNDLLDLTDLAGGPQGAQVAPAPWRKVPLEGWWVSLGGPARLETPSLPGTLVRIFPASETPQAATHLSLELWLDPYREALEGKWIEETLPRYLGVATYLSRDDAIQVYDASRPAPHQEGRWRGARLQESGHTLVRWRGSNGHPQHFWGYWVVGQLKDARSIPSEIACQTRFLLDRLEENPIIGRFEAGPEACSFWCPSWLPRAEYRLLRAVSLCRPSSLREPWTMPLSLAGPVLRLLKQRLHLEWEGPAP